jgi:hypothetical protein
MANENIKLIMHAILQRRRLEKFVVSPGALQTTLSHLDPYRDARWHVKAT